MELTRKIEAQREEGFTLLELLVVLAILGVLATIAVPRVIGYLGGAKSDAAGIQIERLGSALDLYRLDVGRYPSEQDGLDVLIERPGDVANWSGPYLKKREMLLDPWGRQVRYRQPGEYGEIDLFTYGADDAEGGEGEDEDRVSW